MRYVGLDVHKSQTEMCVLDERGKVVSRRSIRGEWHAIAAAVRALGKKDVTVCFEASQGAGFLRDRLREAAEKVLAADPAQVEAIWRSKRKHDRADAQWLAKLTMLDSVPESHVPEEEVRAWRQLIEYRRRLLGKRTAVKTAIRAHLRAHGKAAKGRGLWTRAGLARLAAEKFGTEMAALRRDMLLTELAEAEAQLRRATKALDAKAAEHRGVQLLMTIPGVGARTAEAAVAYIDEAERFDRTKRVGSYFGLVPVQDQSGPRNRLGRITRRGPSVVRWLLTEAAWQGIRRSPKLRGFYERVRKGDPDRRKLAAVATAHFLARAMLAMLKSGEAWRESA